MVPSLKRNSLACFCLFATFTEVVLTEIVVSTACFGSSKLECNAHRLRCSSPSVIDVINNTYGYRSGCNTGVGINICPNVCCKENLGDSLKLFISADDVKVQTECEDKSSCLFTGMRIGDVNNVYNAYSRIEYRCVTKDIYVSTACFGASRLECNTHRLRCSSKSVIDIINNTYGYRSVCNNDVGVSSCPNVCCKERHGDSFKLFISADDVKVQTECEDKSSCLFTGMRIRDVNNVYNAYSRIEYRCVTKAKYTSLSISINTQQTSEVTTVSQPYQSTNISTTGISTGSRDGTGAIVGGIVGALVVIGVLLALGFFIFKRKTKQRKSEENTNNLNTNGSLPTNTDSHYINVENITMSSNDTDNYDKLDVRQATVPSGGVYDYLR